MRKPGFRGLLWYIMVSSFFAILELWMMTGWMTGWASPSPRDSQGILLEMGQEDAMALRHELHGDLCWDVFLGEIQRKQGALKHILVGGFNHLENMKVNGKDYPIYYGKKKMMPTERRTAECWHSQLWPHQLPTECQPLPTGSAFRKDLKSISRGVRSVQSFLQWWSWITTILPYLCSAGTPRVIPADHPKKGSKGVPKPSSVGKHG